MGFYLTDTVLIKSNVIASFYYLISIYIVFFFSEPKPKEVNITPEALPLKTLENNIVIVSCDDNPITLGKVLYFNNYVYFPLIVNITAIFLLFK